MKKLALITYNFNHLKTEQIINNLLIENFFEITLLALPFKQRKQRESLFVHRPDPLTGIQTKDFELSNIKFTELKKSEQLEDFDYCMITGAGILDKTIIGKKKILNIHPGIIPTTRGLDSFKWAIYNLNPLGISLHYIDVTVDSGEVLRIFETPIYRSDTLQTLARRHYENEIYVSSNFYKFLDKVEYRDLKEQKANMRMPIEKEKLLEKKFIEYKKKFCK
tara:strand:- start:28 stop:690 length:663 start_codon:yes stop_codon:yes gene_type:complete